ncbi:glycosyl hydrolase 53 family protein [Agromyces sp. SYSU T00194]|uniref:glycosyl hydrolase 53 family protein n=1 Tax=Agromyces chitinivorans TaxID=3158560 RepID=UPI00339877E5
MRFIPRRAQAREHDPVRQRRIRLVVGLALSALLGGVMVAAPPQSQPAEAVGPNLLVNPGFESGITGWTNIGQTQAVSSPTGDAHSGTRSLRHGANGKWKVNTVQTLTGLTTGTYALTAWVRNPQGAQAGLQAYSCGDPAAQSLELPTTSSWTRVTLVVSVLTSSCTVGIWSNDRRTELFADDFHFSVLDHTEARTMAVGGDITYRRLTADAGGVWSTSNGVPQDVLDVLAADSFNLARIRIYNEPGNFVTVDGDSVQLQPGWQDLDDAVLNAQAAEARGMELFISLHYSDFWTNPGLQIVPEAWQGYSQAQLEDAAYDYTREVMQTLQAAGVTPEYISIGNEINNAVAGIDRYANPAGYYAFLAAASAGVRSVSSSTQIVIHLTTPGEWLYNDWITLADTYGLDYDIMGLSLYPFWTDMSIASLANFATWVSDLADRQTMVVEVGYPWTTSAYDPGGTTLIEGNGLDPDGPENYGATQAGQLRYLKEYFRAMQVTGSVDGIAYWDPIAIDLGDPDPNGWIVGGDNAVEDTTLFDYSSEHRATSGLEAFSTW